MSVQHKFSGVESFIEIPIDIYKLALNSHAIVTLTNSQGIIIAVNQLFCEISQYEKNEIIGKTHKVINSKYHSSSFWDEMYHVLRRGEVFRAEIKNRKKDGTYYWVDSSIYPILNELNETIYYLAIRTDITHKVLERERQLEQFVRYVSIGHLFRDLSHELRNGITVLSMLNDSLKSKLDSGILQKVSSDFAKAEKVINLLGLIVNSSLNTQTESNDFKRVSFLEIEELVQDILALMIKRRGFVFNFNKSYQGDYFVLCSNKIEILQIFFNLAINSFNSLKQSSNKWINVNIIKENSFIKLEFEDSGEGIPQDIANKLFTMGFSSNENLVGNGVGLYISRILSEKNGTELSYDISKKNTTFVLTFKICE